MKPRQRNKTPLDIAHRANRVLNIVLIGLILIALRVWQLTIIQHEEKLEEAKKPQKRIVIEPAKRGTIRDRFNLPLAINKIKYQAAVVYSPIRQIPAVRWETVEGKKVKHFKRKEYIRSLAELLGAELSMDPDRIEDLLHSKASLYNHLPYVIKEDITEQEYYRLKMLEKDWVGIQVQSFPVRCYPMGRVAADIIGYTGAISREEYDAIVQEIKALEHFLEANPEEPVPELPKGIQTVEEAEARLHDLIEHAYMVHDSIGKTGIEAKFEEKLRGYHGKKSYYADAQGNFIKELDDPKPPSSGQRLLLTLSAELQQFAEELLIKNEEIRHPRITEIGDPESKSIAKKHPWMKGGAIVALDPNTGEVLAMATYPRYDPNDFISSGNPEISASKNREIRRWFETDDYLGEIWDQRRPLERESFDPTTNSIVEQGIVLDWDNYLKFVLPEDSPVKEALKQIQSVSEAIRIQQSAERLYSLVGQGRLYPVLNLIYSDQWHVPHGPKLPAVLQEDLEDKITLNQAWIQNEKKFLAPYFTKMPHHYDKVLFLDLCRLIIDPAQAAPCLESTLDLFSLSDYKRMHGACVIIESAAKKLVRALYRDASFRPWRENHQKAFLKQKREEERAKGIKYPKPYLDLLDKQEEELFHSFWMERRWNFLYTLLTGAAPEENNDLSPFFHYFATWHKEIAEGAHQALDWHAAYQALQQALKPLSETSAVALMESFRPYQELRRPLFGKYRNVRSEGGIQTEKNLAAAFYPLNGFGYGRSHAYRQAATQGSIFKIVTGYEALAQKSAQTDRLPKAFADLNPLTMVDDTHKRGKAVYVGYDTAGKPIPQLYKGGRIPRSHKAGIGQLDMIKAFEISSNPYFALLTVDCMQHPNDLANAAKKFGFGARTGIQLPAEIPGNVPNDLDCNRNGLYAMAIGQHSLVVTPLQTAVMLSTIANGGHKPIPKIVDMTIGKQGVESFPSEFSDSLTLSKDVKEILFEGMYRVFQRTQQSAWSSLAEIYADFPDAISDLIDMNEAMIGKSSTSESVEQIDLDLKQGMHIYNHTWFGGIVFDEETRPYTFKDPYGNPELVVVVYLRYGSWGKDTVPVAAQIAKKWREIKKSHLKETEM